MSPDPHTLPHTPPLTARSHRHSYIFSFMAVFLQPSSWESPGKSCICMFPSCLFLILLFLNFPYLQSSLFGESEVGQVAFFKDPQVTGSWDEIIAFNTTAHWPPAVCQAPSQTGQFLGGVSSHPRTVLIVQVRTQTQRSYKSPQLG